MGEKIGFYALLFLGIVILGLAIYFARKPIWFLLKVLRNSALGGLLLILLNTLGFSMGVNGVTALTVGLFGIPGIIALYILKTLVV